MQHKIIKFWVFIISICFSHLLFSQKDLFDIAVNTQKSIGKMQPLWAWFGYDEPNYTYMKDGKKLLSEIAALSKTPVYVRAHSLLTTGDGKAALKWGSTNAYTEDANGNPIYDWTLVDSIFNVLVQNGMKPMVEIGFTPEAMSVKPQPYRHYWKPGDPYNDIYTGWSYPPKDYVKWANLIYEWVSHCVTKYGQKEVDSWRWEVWNEPNIKYWQGTKDEYFKLYDYTVDAVKRASPQAQVGGPATTDPSGTQANQYLKDFLIHCDQGTNYATQKIGSPLDFISFHAKGSPKVLDKHVRMNLGKELSNVTTGFETIKSSAFSQLPIIISEFDPEGCAACGMKTSPQNAYRNGTMYSSYTAAAYSRLYELADFYKVNLVGAVTWAFEFEDQPWFDGFRDLATNGVDKPVLNVFRMLGMMEGDRVEVINPKKMSAFDIRDQGVIKELPDVHALASSEAHSVSVLVWNYHDDDLASNDAAIKLLLKDIPTKKAKMSHYRIDQSHSNSYEVWKKMGSPQNLSSDQYKILEQSGRLALWTKPKTIKISKETVLEFDLPRQGVSLVRVSW